mgnify:CR=1 FL=1
MPRLAKTDVMFAHMALHLAAGLSPSARRVGAAIIEHYNKKTGQCDPSIERLARIYGNLLEGAGCTVFEERAVLEDAHTVRMGDRRVTADRILIATGGWPTLTDEPGAREYGITSNEIFHLPERPQRVVIAGGGYIGVEFAGILHGFGSEVTQVYRGPLFLRGFDIDLREALSEQMASAGISLRFNTKITRIER